MIDFEKNLSEEFEFRLSRVEYEGIEQPAAAEKLEVITFDEVVAEAKDSHILLTLTRKLSFKPSSLFAITVCFEVAIPLMGISGEDLGGEDIATAFKETPNAYVNDIFSRASLLISQITAAGGQIPIVTPPIPIK